MSERIAEWTPDCMGKWDYDADIVRLSSRYWPRGGGFLTFDTSNRKMEGNESRPEIKPSAVSNILLYDQEVATASFEGETEEEVKAKVEAWAAAQVAIIKHAIALVYKR